MREKKKKINFIFHFHNKTKGEKIVWLQDKLKGVNVSRTIYNTYGDENNDGDGGGGGVGLRHNTIQ